MANGRSSLFGLFGALLALMVQLGAGASVPRIDPISGTALCHADDGAGGAPSPAPFHGSYCPICPLCIALHAPSAILASVSATPLPPVAAVVLKTELPPPSTAPPSPHRPPSQPRAPPIVS
jgi:hypothetical protein